MAQFLEKYLGHAITVFISVILAGLIGYYSAYVSVIDRIHAVNNVASQRVNTLNASYIKISTDIEHIRKTLDETVVPKLQTVAGDVTRNASDLRLIKDRLGRVSAYIDQLEETKPERIRQEERGRIWKIGVDRWRGKADERIENLSRLIRANPNP